MVISKIKMMRRKVNNYKIMAMTGPKIHGTKAQLLRVLSDKIVLKRHGGNEGLT